MTAHAHDHGSEDAVRPRTIRRPRWLVPAVGVGVVAGGLVLAGVIPLTTMIYAGLFGGMLLMHLGGHGGHGGHGAHGWSGGAGRREPQRAGGRGKERIRPRRRGRPRSRRRRPGRSRQPAAHRQLPLTPTEPSSERAGELPPVLGGPRPRTCLGATSPRHLGMVGGDERPLELAHACQCIANNGHHLSYRDGSPDRLELGAVGTINRPAPPFLARQDLRRA